jgi:hypothetical protein
MSMADYPPEWHRLLELLAGSANGCTAAVLFAHGFSDAVIAGLVDTGLATSTIERVLAAGRNVDVMRLRITDRGRLALER